MRTEPHSARFATLNRARVADLRAVMPTLSGPALTDAISDAIWHEREAGRLDDLARTRTRRTEGE